MKLDLDVEFYNALLNQAQRSECFRNVVNVSIRRLPGDTSSIGRRALKAIKIHPQFTAGDRWTFVDLFNRYAHGAIPDVLRVINFRFDLESRIPVHIVIRRVRISIDEKIDPLAAG